MHNKYVKLLFYILRSGFQWPRWQWWWIKLSWFAADKFPFTHHQWMGERRGGTNWPGPTNPHCQQRYLAIADPNQIHLESSLFFAISTYFCVYFHICHVLCEWRIGYIDRAPTQVYNLFQMWVMGNALHSTIHTWKFPELLIILHLFLCILLMNYPLHCFQKMNILFSRITVT